MLAHQLLYGSLGQATGTLWLFRVTSGGLVVLFLTHLDVAESIKMPVVPEETRSEH
jgi:hypothetical protein